MKERVLYFAYDNKIDVVTLKGICEKAKYYNKGELEGYELFFDKVAVIKKNKEKRVPIVIWSLDEEDEECLDIYEGVPTYSSKRVVTAKDKNGSDIRGVVYIKNNSEKKTIPEEKYYNDMLENYKLWGFDIDILERAKEDSLSKNSSKHETKIVKKKVELDLTSKRYGKLVVLKYAGRSEKTGYKQWLCKCDCGNEKAINQKDLLSGDTKSCGCLKKESRSYYGLFEGTNIVQLKKRSYLINENDLDEYKILPINSSGCYGVTKVKDKYKASITVQGKCHYLGIYSKIEDAIKARKEAEEKYFKPLIERFDELDNYMKILYNKPHNIDLTMKNKAVNSSYSSGYSKTLSFPK